MDATALAETLGRVVLNPLILLLFGVALVVFGYGLVRFLWAANVGGKDSNTGKSHMLWGVVGMVVMTAAYGILHLIDNTLKSIH